MIKRLWLPVNLLLLMLLNFNLSFGSSLSCHLSLIDRDNEIQLQKNKIQYWMDKNSSLSYSEIMDFVIRSIADLPLKVEIVETLELQFLNQTTIEEIKVLPWDTRLQILFSKIEDLEKYGKLKWKSPKIKNEKDITQGIQTALNKLNEFEIKRNISKISLLRQGKQYTSQYQIILSRLVRESGSVQNFMESIDPEMSSSRLSSLGKYSQVLIRTIKNLMWFNHTRLIRNFKLSEDDYRNLLGGSGSFKLSFIHRLEIWIQLRLAQSKYISHAMELALLLALTPTFYPYYENLNLESQSVQVPKEYQERALEIREHEKVDLVNAVHSALNEAKETGGLNPSELQLIKEVEDIIATVKPEK